MSLFAQIDIYLIECIGRIFIMRKPISHTPRALRSWHNPDYSLMRSVSAAYTKVKYDLP